MSRSSARRVLCIPTGAAAGSSHSSPCSISTTRTATKCTTGHREAHRKKPSNRREQRDAQCFSSTCTPRPAFASAVILAAVCCRPVCAHQLVNEHFLQLFLLMSLPQSCSTMSLGIPLLPTSSMSFVIQQFHLGSTVSLPTLVKKLLALLRRTNGKRWL